MYFVKGLQKCTILGVFTACQATIGLQNWLKMSKCILGQNDPKMPKMSHQFFFDVYGHILRADTPLENIFICNFNVFLNSPPPSTVKGHCGQ